MNSNPLTVHAREGRLEPQNVNIIEPVQSPPARSEAASTQIRRETFASDPIEQNRREPSPTQTRPFRLSPGQTFSMGQSNGNSPSSRRRIQTVRQVRTKQVRSTPDRQAPGRRTARRQRARQVRPFVGGMQAQTGKQSLKPCPPIPFIKPPKNISQRDFEQLFLMPSIEALVENRHCHNADVSGLAYALFLVEQRFKRFKI